MPTIEALAIYFTSPVPLGIIASIVSSELISSLIFLKSNAPRNRSNALTLMFGSSVSLWLFIAMSILLCNFLSHDIEYSMAIVKTTAGFAFLIGLIIAVPSSIMLKNIAPRRWLRKTKNTKPVFGPVAHRFRAVSRDMGMKQAELLQLDLKAPACIAVGGERNIVLVTKSLLHLLNTDELEAVFAHEFAHIIHGDLAIKGLMAIYRRIIPFDPLIRFTEAAMHRERELMADEAAVEAGKKPNTLASALIKIHEALPEFGPQQPTGFLASRRGFFRKDLSLEKRVKQLLRMTH